MDATAAFPGTTIEPGGSRGRVPIVGAFGQVAPGIVRGVTANQVPHWRKALAKVRSGTADARILCVGDSTTFGYGGTSTTQMPTTSWPAKMSALLNSYYVSSALGLAIPVPSGNSFDNRWTLGTGWALEGSNNGWVFNDYKANASSGALAFAPGAVAGSADTFDVYYIGTGSTAQFTIQATGGSATTVTPGALNGIGKATCTAAAAGTGNSVSITTLTGSLRVVGVEARLSTAKRVLVGNAGVSGSSAVGWNSTVSNPTYGSLACIQGYAPDVTIIDLGINDAASNANAAAFTSNLTPVITAAQVSGDVILKTFVPSFDDGTLGPNEASILTQIAALASSFGCGVIDTNSRFASYAAASAAGFMFDVLHPNDVGYSDVAQQVAVALQNI